MTDPLRAVAQAVLARWDSPQWQWAKQGPTADLMEDLRAALAAAQPAQAKPTDGLCTAARLVADATPDQLPMALDALRDHMELAQAEPQPVAWLRQDGEKVITDTERQAWIDAGRADLVDDYTRPLHPQTAYQSAAKAPARVALTDDEIWRIGMKWAKEDGWADFDRNDFIACVREAAGIQASTDGGANG